MPLTLYVTFLVYMTFILNIRFKKEGAENKVYKTANQSI